jgi:catechol 2,3-dioxygenase-like lactoylglutathione lyase family enzyme
MIKVRDVAFVRFGVPDLDAMARFTGDFGLVTSERSDTALYSRGTDPEPFIHVAELGEPGYRGVAFDAASGEDLAAAARLDGASAVEDLDGPGGGKRVRFVDPDGFPVEVVHGRDALEPLPVRPTGPHNRGSEQTRRGEPLRFPRGPAQVKRIGHAVVRVSDFRQSEAWYKSRFGFVSSDEVYLGEPDQVITAFMRCDRGSEYVDHHSFLCVGVGEVGFEHAAFEVEDYDDVMIGHDHLAAAGYDHHAGIGRHVLGSQVFDYWRDPWGNVIEHFADGDLFNDQAATNLHDPGVALGTLWGRFA